MEHLPAYSPDLNPDEQVWNHAKARLGKLFVATKEEFKTALFSIMFSLQRTPELVRSFFQLVRSMRQRRCNYERTYATTK